MIDYIFLLWSLPVRAGPVIAGVLAFAAVNGIRRWFRFQYTPSYFVLFPVSLLDHDVARFTGMGPWGRPETELEKRQLKRAFLVKATIAAVITFVMIPALLGIVSAVYMRVPEFAVTLTMLLTWQSYAAFQSITDNTRYSERPRSSASFFTIFYLFYLASLGGFMQRAYAFTRLYVVKGDWGGLLSAGWNVIFVVLVAGVIIGVLANLMTYFITERDVI